MIRDLYVENSVGRALTDTINRFTRNHGVTAYFQHDIHPEMQRPQKGDEWWIADIAARGMAILTQDAAILGIRQRLQQGIMTAERQAVVDNAAHVFAFGDAKYTQWQKLRCLLGHWDAIVALLDTPGPQAGVLYLSSFAPRPFPNTKARLRSASRNYVRGRAGHWLLGRDRGRSGLFGTSPDDSIKACPLCAFHHLLRDSGVARPPIGG